MIKHGLKETLEMYEIMNNDACMIDHFSDYIMHCQDSTLRSILENQRRHLMDNYQRKASVMQSHGMDTSRLPRVQTGSMQVGMNQGVSQTAQTGLGAQMGNNLQQAYAGGQGNYGVSYAKNSPHYTGYGNQQQQVGQASGRIMNDSTIATGALTFHKYGATRSAQAALECTEPHLRNLLTTASKTCSDMAFEVFNYMEQRGMYSTPVMTQNFVSHTQQQNFTGNQTMGH